MEKSIRCQTVRAKANKKAVLREITDDAFGVMPQRRLLPSGWRFKDAYFDALQVQNNGSFSGNVNGNVIPKDLMYVGLRFSVNTGSDKYVYGVVNNAVADSQVNLGDSTVKFKDGYFSGSVNAHAFLKPSNAGWGFGSNTFVPA